VTDVDIGWFQISVNDSLVVRGLQRIGDLMHVIERLLERNRPAQSVAIHQLQHKALHIAGFFQTVDGGYIGVA
jgi:hypothetical protein